MIAAIAKAIAIGVTVTIAKAVAIGVTDTIAKAGLWYYCNYFHLPVALVSIVALDGIADAAIRDICGATVKRIRSDERRCDAMRDEIRARGIGQDWFDFAIMAKSWQTWS